MQKEWAGKLIMRGETTCLGIKFYFMKFVIFLFLLTGLSSCTEDLDDILNAKIRYLEQEDTVFQDGYTIKAIRDDANSGYTVSRLGPPDGYAVISTVPKAIIEKNFVLEDSLTVSFVEAFAKLKCSYLYYSQGFKRIDFFKRQGLFKKKLKVILFKGHLPKSQNFITANSSVKEFNDGWKYLIIK